MKKILYGGTKYKKEKKLFHLHAFFIRKLVAILVLDFLKIFDKF